MRTKTVRVAFHRWFADGEGWSHDRWYTPRLAAVLSILDRPLKDEEEGDFAEPGLGGLFVGETCPDPDCLDRRAAARRPTILRVGFVSPTPSAVETVAIREALRALPLPERRGEQTLHFTVPAGGELASRSARRTVLWLAAGMILLLGGLVGLGLLLGH